jgi:hypothetical protein
MNLFMNRTNMFRWLVVLLLLGVAPMLRAESLDSSVIGLFPKNVAEVGYADLQHARRLSWFAQFKQQALPASYVEFEQFLKSSGIDPNTQVQQVAGALGVSSPDDSRDVASGSDDILGVALGDFDPESVQALYKSRKLATSEVRGYTLYACGNGASCSGMFFCFWTPTPWHSGGRNCWSACSRSAAERKRVSSRIKLCSR